MSVKAPTPVLHHKRTLSSLNRPSPGTPASVAGPSPAASSPERAQKRARFDGLPLPTALSPAESKVAPSPLGGAADKDRKNAGVQWVLGQIKIMEQQYKESVIAAVLVMQHKAYSRKFRIQNKGVPIHLSERLEHAWASYEATRRQIEYYIIQCAEHHATPSKPAPPTLPPPAAIPSRLTPQTIASSPVPLNPAAMMAFSPSDAGKLANLASAPGGLPALPDGGLVFSTADGGTLDLGSMNIDELNAIINGSNFDFRSIPSVGPSGMTPAPGEMSAMTPNTQAETDRLIASLSNIGGSGATPGGGIGVGIGVGVGAGTGATPGGEDVDSLLARLAKSDEQGGTENDFTFDFNTDLGDLDLGNLTDLAGLFDSANPSQGGTGTATPAIAPPAPAAASAAPPPAAPPSAPAPAAASSTEGPPAETQPRASQPQQPDSALTGLEGLLGGTGDGTGNDIVDLNLDGLVDSGEYDLEGGINMDDFDFGDGQIPSVDGEDFDAMFKDFQ